MMNVEKPRLLEIRYQEIVAIDDGQFLTRQEGQVITVPAKDVVTFLRQCLATYEAMAVVPTEGLSDGT